MESSLKEIAEFYDQYPEEIGNLLVETRYGYKTIEAAAITAYNEEVWEVLFDDETVIRSSANHRLWTNNKWGYVKDIIVGDTCESKNGNRIVKSIKNTITKMDLYDLQVAEVHEFYANGIVSHNSTFMDAICFCLFNKPFRSGLNKSDLVNSINDKDCVVEVELENNGNQYLVRRGMKPAVFEIIMNGKKIDKQSSVVKDQEAFEKSVLKTTHKTFTSFVVLGMASFTSFMNMSTTDRRVIVEDLLNIQIISAMNVLAKKTHSDRKRKIQQLESERDAMLSARTILEKNLSDLKKNDSSRERNLLERCAGLVRNIEDNNKKCKELQDTLQERGWLDSKIEEIETKVRDYEKKGAVISSNRERLDKEVRFFTKNDDCPTCGQTIDKSLRDQKISHGEKSLDEIDTGLTRLKDVLATLKSSKTELSRRDDKNEESWREVQSLQRKIESDESRLKDLRAQMDVINDNSLVIENMTRDIRDSRLKEDEVNKELKKLYTEQKYDQAMIDLLKDGGIKAVVVRKYLPIINKAINEYLQRIDFFCSFELDETFNAEIKSRQVDTFKYGNFSQGEKFRIDLAILFAWRKVSSVINSIDCNLLIFDEMFDSSLDAQGTEDCMSIINDLMHDRNVFVVSHRRDMADKFDRVLEFTKKDFSQMEVI